jgi:hypothetical protein
MVYISSVANRWPILRIATRIVLAFCCAAPFAWMLSNLIVHGLRTFVD